MKRTKTTRRNVRGDQNWRSTGFELSENPVPFASTYTIKHHKNDGTFRLTVLYHRELPMQATRLPASIS